MTTKLAFHGNTNDSNAGAIQILAKLTSHPSFPRTFLQNAYHFFLSMVHLLFLNAYAYSLSPDLHDVIGHEICNQQSMSSKDPITCLFFSTGDNGDDDTANNKEKEAEYLEIANSMSTYQWHHLHYHTLCMDDGHDGTPILLLGLDHSEDGDIMYPDMYANGMKRKMERMGYPVQDDEME
eukprot:1299522-Ditylum_brightwellii.AAC.1